MSLNPLFEREPGRVQPEVFDAADRAEEVVEPDRFADVAVRAEVVGAQDVGVGGRRAQDEGLEQQPNGQTAQSAPTARQRIGNPKRGWVRCPERGSAESVGRVMPGRR